MRDEGMGTQLQPSLEGAVSELKQTFRKKLKRDRKAHEKWAALSTAEQCASLEKGLANFVPGGKYADKPYAAAMFRKLRWRLLRLRNER